MANLTSSQNGNFSASSTWGGSTPAEGDTLTINHTVTIDTSTTVPTNGYGDITVGANGILTNDSGSTLRVNGVLKANGGTLHFKDTFTGEFKGTNGDNHGIRVKAADNSNIFIEGDDPADVITTTTSVTDGNVCTHALTDASNYAVGDWIQIYSYDYTSTTTEQDGQRFDDEGFWIHDINGNTVYTRDYVGPEDSTISRVVGSGGQLIVSNAKVFRKGMQVIFGTGSNRNIKTISNISYNRNLLILDSAVTGEVVGETVYRAASLKPHPAGSKVRKMAWSVTTEAASGQANIELNTTAGLSAGDRIWIEMRSEALSNTDANGRYGSPNKTMDFVIQSISGNTITITTNLEYKVVVGSLVANLTKSIKFKTVATDGSDYAHLYMEQDTTDWNRYCVLKDVEFIDWGDDDDNVRTGVVIRGLNRIKDGNEPITLTQTIPSQHRGSWVEGVSITNYYNHERDWGSLRLYDCRSAVARGCIALYGDDGISGHHEPYLGVLGCITAGNESFGFRIEGGVELYDIAYLYSSRNQNRVRTQCNNMGIGGQMHNVIVDATDCATTGWYSQHPGGLWRCKFTGLKHTVTTEGVNDPFGGFVDCYIKTLSGYTTDRTSGAFRQSHYDQGGNSRPLTSIEHNFEYDGIKLYGYSWSASWDESETAWHFTRYASHDQNPSMGETVYIPPNVTGRLTCKVKAVDNFSGTRPVLFALDQKSAELENALGFTATTNRPLRGKRYNEQYTEAFESGYEEKQITISPEPYSRYYKIGIRSGNRNAAEGFYIKEFNFYLDGAPGNRFFHSANHGSLNLNTVPQFRSSFTQQKKRLGGRIR